MENEKNEINGLIEDGKKFDEMLNYVKNKLTEPSRLGNGNSNNALSELTNDIKYIKKFVNEKLEKHSQQKKKTEGIRQYSLQVISELESELDNMELAASRNGYIPFNLINTSNSMENTSACLETPDMSKSFESPEMRKGIRGKKLEFNGMD